MTDFDFNRPFISDDKLDTYEAIDHETSQRYGKFVKATTLSNREYLHRFQKLKNENNMREPPSSGRIFPGYLVVRKLGLKDQYETWMPDGAFEEIYSKK